MNAPAATYAALLRVRGFAPLLASSLLARTGSQMWAVAIVLFALQRYGSPAVAGLSVFLLILPGLVASPVTGALLDRFGRRRLMRLDFIVAAACLALIAALAALGALPVWLLFVLLVAGSLTSTLSIAGARSMFPLTVPDHLWDRANAADSLCYGMAQVAGPGLAGWLTAVAGGEAALAAASTAFVLAAIALRGTREPAVRGAQGASILGDAAAGIRYVLRNRTLRWLAVSMSLANVGIGLVLVALPVLVFRAHGSPAVVGGMLALQGLVGIPSTLLAGRVRTEGRERLVMAAACAVAAVATAALLLPSLVLVTLAMMAIGFADGPLNVALYSLRQRRTDRRWFGRAFAISLSLNFAGMPIGSALAGPLLAVSLTMSIVFAAALPLLSSLLILARIPRTAERDVAATLG